MNTKSLGRTLFCLCYCICFQGQNTRTAPTHTLPHFAMRRLHLTAMLLASGPCGEGSWGSLCGVLTRCALMNVPCTQPCQHTHTHTHTWVSRPTELLLLARSESWQRTPTNVCQPDREERARGDLCVVYVEMRALNVGTHTNMFTGSRHSS